MLLLALTCCQQKELEIANDQLEIGWTKSGKGWEVDRVKIKAGDEWKEVGIPSGEYTYLYSAQLKQQEIRPGFFRGAAICQYFLAKRKMFVEEWGEFIEPISLTYYTMLDLGNLALFEPENDFLRQPENGRGPPEVAKSRWQLGSSLCKFGI